jgi:osmotically-inducible protein OsmY
MKKSIIFLVLFAFVVGINGVMAATPSKTNVNLEQKKQDAAITAKVKLNLAADNLLKPHKIVVTTKAGVVTLSGMVSSPEAINKAEELTKSVEGVKGVNNNLKTKAPKPLPPSKTDVNRHKGMPIKSIK